MRAEATPAAGGTDARELARARFRLWTILAFALVAAALTFPFVKQLPETARAWASGLALLAAVATQVLALRERRRWRRGS